MTLWTPLHGCFLVPVRAITTITTCSWHRAYCSVVSLTENWGRGGLWKRLNEDEENWEAQDS
jgi:hypothetical protein